MNADPHAKTDVGAALFRATGDPETPQTSRDRADAFLSGCVATWIAARLRDHVVDTDRIVEACSTHVGASVSDHRQGGWPIVTFTLAGVSGQARCLHGALTDWIDQWQQATGQKA